MAILLLTSAVVPSAPVTTAWPTQRLAECLAAIRLWDLVSLFQDIVVCDGSGFQPAKCGNHFGGGLNAGVEWLSYDLSPIARMFGKGRAEAILIERALNNSVVLQKATAFYKATGRLFVDNVSTLTRCVRDDEIVASRHPHFESMIDTRFFYCTCDLFRRVLQPETARIDDAHRRHLLNRFIGGQLIASSRVFARNRFTLVSTRLVPRPD